MYKTFFMILLISLANIALAAAPKLNFSDLISGPDTGLGDGLGSGAVVTVWGQHLGNNQDNSKLSFIDSQGTVYQNIQIYYWKNADGQLPSGPANLFASHKMQEIAFSIPNAAQGTGELYVVVNGVESNKLPFTIRNGDIYHVMTSGSDSSGDGSFASPWETIGKALSSANNPGSTIYVHNSLSTGDGYSTKRAIYWNNTSAASGYSNQFGVIAYPNSQPIAIGRNGFRNFTTSGQLVSKFSVFASDCEEGPNGQPINCINDSSGSSGIQGSAFGRIVANKITDIVGGCADSQAGAIVAGAPSASRNRVTGLQIFGNQIYEYGCAGAAKFHHTTYITIRSGNDNLQVDPWRFGWNYLHDNKVKNGIHQYDENNGGLECGSPTATVIINDNVIINQSGSGINVGANCPWNNDFDIYNNIIINAGLPADWDGIDVDTSNGAYTSGITIQDGGLMGTMNIYNNTIHTWNNDELTGVTEACLGLLGGDDNVTIKFDNNVCYTDKDKPYVNNNWNGVQLLDNVIGNTNSWFFSGANPTEAIPPSWDNQAIINNPLILVSGPQINISANSPLIGQSTTTPLTHDIYGTPRPQNSTVGAIEVISTTLIFIDSFE